MRSTSMDDAFAVVAHPQLLATVGAVLLLGLALMLELNALLQGLWRQLRARPTAPVTQPFSQDGFGHDPYDWMYE